MRQIQTKKLQLLFESTEFNPKGLIVSVVAIGLTVYALEHPSGWLLCSWVHFCLGASGGSFRTAGSQGGNTARDSAIRWLLVVARTAFHGETPRLHLNQRRLLRRDDGETPLHCYSVRAL